MVVITLPELILNYHEAAGHVVGEDVQRVAAHRVFDLAKFKPGLAARQVDRDSGQATA